MYCRSGGGKAGIPMNIPEELKYTKSHEWVKMTGDTAEIGLTDYAQGKLGDLVFVNLPEPGDAIKTGEVFADVESVKAASDVYAPVDGSVAQVNEALCDSPEVINKDPYGAWLARVENVTGAEDLMDAAAYRTWVEQEEAK